jgi:hypothetical protein
MLKILPMLGLAIQCAVASPQASITAEYNARTKSVQVSWRNDRAGTNTFIVQRSNDNKTWKDIVNQQVSAGAPNRIYYYNDNDPAPGENFYRLKYAGENGQSFFSSPVMVITEEAGKNGWVMYPVPVKDMLTLQYRGTEPIKGVINVFLQTMSGKLLLRLRSASSSKTIQIPVDNLGKGIYDIRIVVEGEVMWNQRFVK